MALAGGLASCTGYSRILNFPFDSGGRGLNSPFSEITPETNGRYIVFISDRYGSQDVFLFDAREQRLIDLPGLNAFDTIASHPSISQNGRTIVLAATLKGRSGIYIYNRDLNQLRNITENIQAEVRNPTISADGNTIAYESSENGQWDIVICDRNGKRLNLLIPNL